MFWDSTDIFLEKTFGVVALDVDKKIVAICSSVSDSDNFHEINIEVVKLSANELAGFLVDRPTGLS